MKQQEYKNILNFWFSEEIKPKWFAQDNALDALVTQQFLDAYKQARAQEVSSKTPEEALALIILLDQFPRNMFRGSKEAFATDSKARLLAEQAIKMHYDEQLNKEQRAFIYLPFMHSESLKDQAYSVALFEQLGNPQSLDYAIKHQEIIQQFGRFPHRNNILSRISTKEEALFLNKPGSSF